MESDPLSYSELFLTLFLVFLNGFFVAAEFAIVKVRSSQLETQEDSLVSRIALSIVEHLDAYLAATQLGITIASLALGWVGETTMEHLIHNILKWVIKDPVQAQAMASQFALPVGFFIITMLHIVFGELVPKSLAIRSPFRMTQIIAVPLKIFRTIFLPLILFMNGIANAVLRVFGFTSHEEDVHSEEELKLIISESADGGAIEDSERELINNVFEFDNRLVRQVFVHNSKVIGLPIEDTIEDAAKKILNEGYSRYPVYNKSLDNIIGMVHSKDVLKNVINKDKTKISEIKRDILYVNENKRILDLLRAFQEAKTEFGVVVDEFGDTIGIITMEDILEELVGDIQDEYDDELPIVEKIDNKTYRVYSLNSVDDINEFLPNDIPRDEGYETLSGYIATMSKDMPVVGQVLKDNHYTYKILTMNRRSPELVELVMN